MKCSTCKKEARYRIWISGDRNTGLACGSCLTEHSVTGDLTRWELLAARKQPGISLELWLVLLGILTGVFLAWCYWGIKS
uniref:Uncharacterized protein n=1 Tax=uncultured marine virus TaxID=186617 RepID=A0A0F7L091_9VIRU|nr:hypothetical protein [uncultured marine virus]